MRRHGNPPSITMGNAASLIPPNTAGQVNVTIIGFEGNGCDCSNSPALNLSAADPRLREALREKFEPAMARLNEAATRYKHPAKASLVLLGFVIAGEIFSRVVVGGMAENESKSWLLPLLNVGFVFLGIIYIVHVHCSHNPSVDRDVRAACEEVSRLIEPVSCSLHELRAGKMRIKWIQFLLGGAVSAAVPAAQTFAVTVPPGMPPGTTIAVAAPGGGQVMAQIPPGVAPGMVFHVQAPVATPVGLAGAPVAASASAPSPAPAPGPVAAAGNAAPAPAYEPAPAPANEFLQYAQQGQQGTDSGADAGTNSSASGGDPYSLGSPLELTESGKQKYTA